MTRLLVVAKSPVPGLAKTRLAASVGDRAAAEVAAAALLDTLAAATEAVGPHRCVVSLAGDLDEGVRGAEIRAALDGWTVVPQHGGAFGDRLARAHRDAGPGPVVQVGMDTPQLTPAGLHEAASGLAEADVVLGAADDGGWWVLARHDAAAAEPLAAVPMSTPTTYDDTWAALRAAGLTVAATDSMRDVDDAADADAVAAAAPGTGFARAWLAARSGTLR